MHWPVLVSDFLRGVVGLSLQLAVMHGLGDLVGR